MTLYVDQVVNGFAIVNGLNKKELLLSYTGYGLGSNSLNSVAKIGIAY